MHGKSAPREVTALIQDWIEREHVAGKSFAMIATELSVSKTQIQHVNGGVRGAGPDMEAKFAQRFCGGSIDELRAKARDFYQRKFPAPAEVPDPLPKRAAALGRLHGLLHAEVVRRVVSMRYPEGTTMSEFDWVWTGVQEQLAYERELLRKEPSS